VKNLSDRFHFKEHLTSARDADFQKKALEVFAVQSTCNAIYSSYLQALNRPMGSYENAKNVPFLPISFFKTHEVKTGYFSEETCFESSGTTSDQSSRHFIPSVKQYLNNATENFREFYGEPEQYCFLALLPSYLERGNSSLVAMADHFIRLSQKGGSGFFLDNLNELAERIRNNERSGATTVLLGVTYALLDFAEQFPMQLNHTLVMETGGMKGRRKEITRTELHAQLQDAWGLKSVHAEYGMTELQSQAYSSANGIFYPSSSLRIVLRAMDDPFETWEHHEFPGRAGAVNVIDLANHQTQAFIATDDVGRFTGDGGFEITGRMDNCDIRGCSLLIV